jgi:hypothetical protein
VVFKSFSTKEIITIIKSLKSKNSHGYDEVPTKLLKISAACICSPLTCICNTSIQSQIFPDRLKYSIIKPLYKKGDKMNIANYRPISLLTSFLKVFEKAMYTRFIEHLDSDKILVKEQFGFRKNLKTEEALYKFKNEILKVRSVVFFATLRKHFTLSIMRYYCQS